MDVRQFVVCLVIAVLPGCTSTSHGRGPNPGGDDGRTSGPDAANVESGVVSTAGGPIRGVESGGIWSFKGIPYARPPVGRRRWRAPQPPAPHQQLLEADEFGPACPQDDSALGTGSAGPTDEDCLRLNVWTPDLDPATSHPVMVWIHGGGFVQGSSRKTLAGGTLLYDGTNLASDDVVVVSINYRLGALGFLAHPAFIDEDDGQPGAGNWGLLDQIVALEWVRDNIGRFGGDAERVTIFGESAGAISVCSLMASPLADGLFDRAMMESGNCLANITRLDAPNGDRQPATTQGTRFAEAIGCSEAADVAECMRQKSARQVLDILPGAVGTLGRGESYGPIVDGNVLEQSPASAIKNGDAARVPLVIGANADEGTLFSSSQRNMTATAYRSLVHTTYPAIGDQVVDLYPADGYERPWLALSAIVGDVSFVCPSRQIARAHTANANTVYTYYYTHATAVGGLANLGAFHSAELSFVFGNFAATAGRGDEAVLSERMQTWWAQFARDGAPGAADSINWPAYEADGDRWLQLDTDPIGPTSGVRDKYCDFWGPYLQ